MTRVMQLYGQEPIKISFHPAMFGGNRHSCSGDMVLVVIGLMEMDQLLNQSLHDYIRKIRS